MAIRYAVDGVHDDQGALRDRLSEIAEEGGRVISITWQPERLRENGTSISAGFTVVTEVDA